METFDIRSIPAQAEERLCGKDHRRLAALHTGVIVAVAVLITLLQYVLATGIGNTSGLSGLGTRSVLETGQMVLQWANILLVPFWNLGFLYAALLWSRGGDPRKEDLLAGFRRVGPCIGLMLNRGILTFFVMLLCVNLCTVVFTVLPASGPLMELAAAAEGDVDAFYTMMENMEITELARAAAPLMICWGVSCLIILVPLLYRFRMAEYVILDEPRARGLSSMVINAALLRRRCWKLFRLDLRFWWYYGLKLLCALLCYSDVLLAIVGIQLPVSGDGVYFASYGLYLAGLFCVEVAFRARVDTAYALAFDELKALGPAVKKQTPANPGEMPWDEE